MHETSGNSNVAADALAGSVNPLGAERDEEHFVAIYQRTYDRLVRTAFLMVDSTELAEEVVQDAFGRLYQRHEHVERPEEYVRRSVVNGCFDVLRRRKRERQQPLPPESSVEPLDYLADALERLPAKQRVAVVLRYYDGLQEAEIAEAMGCPRGSVKTHLRRGLARLREALDGV